MNSMMPLWGYNLGLTPYLTAGAGAPLQCQDTTTAARQEAAQPQSQWPWAAAAPFATATMINSQSGVPVFIDGGPGMGLMGLSAAAPGAAAYGCNVNFGVGSFALPYGAFPAAPCGYPASHTLSSLQSSASFPLTAMNLMREGNNLIPESAASAFPLAPAAAYGYGPAKELGLTALGLLQDVPVARIQGPVPRSLCGDGTARPRAPTSSPSADPSHPPIKKRLAVTIMDPPAAPPLKRAAKSLHNPTPAPARASSQSRNPGSSRQSPASAPAMPQLENGGGESRLLSPDSQLERQQPRGVPTGLVWQRRLAVRLDGPHESYMRCLDYRTFDSVLSLGCDIAWALFPDPRVVELDPMMVVLVDSEGREWPCRYHALVSKHSYVLRSGWRQFVEANKIAKGDSVVLSRDDALDSLDNSRVHIELRRRSKSNVRLAAAADSIPHGVLMAPASNNQAATVSAAAAAAVPAAAADRDIPYTPLDGLLDQEAPVMDGSADKSRASCAAQVLDCVEP